jgi:hypothetical protein
MIKMLIKYRLFCLVIICALATTANAQMLNRKFTSKTIKSLGERTLSKNYLNDPDYSGKTILLLTPSFPISFSRLEQDTAKNWRIGPSIGIGGSYFFLVGKGYRNANETVQVEPYFVLGLSIEGGVSQNLQAPGVVGNLNIGGVLGFYKYFNFLFSYDVLNNRPVYGVGARVDLFTLTQGAGTIILNKAKFFE